MYKKSIFIKVLFLFIFFSSFSSYAQQNKVEEILKSIREGNYESIEKVKETLTKIGSSQLDLLISALKDENENVRIIIAEVLGKIKNASAVLFLIEVLKNDESSSVREVSAKSLGEIKSIKAIESLVLALRDKNMGVRIASASSLDKLGWTPKNNLEKVDYLIAKQKWDECIKMGKEAVDSLILSFGAEPYYYNEDEMIIECLIKIGKPSINPLINALKNQDENIRKYSAMTLGKMKEKSAVENLLNLLKDKSSEVKSSVIEALGNIGDIRAIDPLIECLKEKENEQIIKSAIIALGDLKSEKSVPLLINFLTDKNVEIRCLTTESLGKIKSPVAVKPLIKRLKDPEPMVRATAVKSLGEIKSSEAIPYLISTLIDENADVRKNGTITLDKLGWKPETPNETILYFIAKQDWNKCVDYGKMSVDLLLDYIEDEDPYIRENVIRTLGKIKDVRAVERLIASSAIKDEYDNVRKAVVEALGNIGDKRAIPILISALRDWEVGPTAANSLEKLKWIPINIEDKIHYWVAKRWKKTLISVWEETKTVLLKDVKSEEYLVIENALYAFIGIGKEEIIPVLIKTLKEEGTKTMAEAYLNCGNDILYNAAKEWAKENGYIIIWGGGYCPVVWGGL